MFMLHLMYFETKIGIKNEEMMKKLSGCLFLGPGCWVLVSCTLSPALPSEVSAKDGALNTKLGIKTNNINTK